MHKTLYIAAACLLFSCSSKNNDSDSISSTVESKEGTISYTEDELEKIDSMYRLYAKYGWTELDSGVTEDERRKMFLEADFEEIEDFLKSMENDPNIKFID